MRGHEPDGVRAGVAAGEGVGGDVLGVELFEEVDDAPAADALLGAGGGLEEGADGVEVAVGVPPGGAAAQGGALQAAGPGGALPQLPEGFLGGAAGGEQRSGVPEEPAEPLYAVGVRGVVRDEPLGLGERAGEQHVGGRRHPVPGGPLLVPQRPPEPPQVGRVDPGERRGEQCERGLRVEPPAVAVTAGTGAFARTHA